MVTDGETAAVGPLRACPGNGGRARGTRLITEIAAGRGNGNPACHSHTSCVLVACTQYTCSIQGHVDCAARAERNGRLQPVGAIKNEIGIQHGPFGYYNGAIARQIAKRCPKRTGGDHSPVGYGQRAVAIVTNAEIGGIVPHRSCPGNGGRPCGTGIVAEIAAGVADLPARLNGERAAAVITDAKGAAVGPFRACADNAGRPRGTGIVAQITVGVADLPARLDGECATARASDVEIAAVGPFRACADNAGRPRGTGNITQIADEIADLPARLDGECATARASDVEGAAVGPFRACADNAGRPRGTGNITQIADEIADLPARLNGERRCRYNRRKGCCCWSISSLCR